MSRKLLPTASLDALAAAIRATRARLDELPARAELVGPAPARLPLAGRAVPGTAALNLSRSNARFLAVTASLGMVGFELAVASRDGRWRQQRLCPQPPSGKG